MLNLVPFRAPMRMLLWAACLAGPVGALAALPAAAGAMRPDGAVVNFHVMHHMDGYTADNVDSPLVAAQDGNLYGVSRYGGLFGDGTIFRMTPSGGFRKLHTFEVESEASRPQGLVQASDGHFYGTARYGGWSGRGTVYRFDPPDDLTTIHDFHAPPDGSQPANAVIVGTDGDLYGTTFSGGAFGVWGTAFRTSRSGETTVLHSFKNDGIDGFYPYSRLTQGSDGNLYGTTWKGGRHGRGIAFRLTAQGDFTMLHEFDGSDGEKILSSLTEGPDGLFYGVAHAGGANGVGTLFRLSREGDFTVLLSFERHSQGAHPTGDLLVGRDGYLYGVTKAGGRGDGTIYRIALDGTFTVLHNLDGESDGKAPLAGLVERDDGEFFGVTSQGGQLSHGTVFRLRVK